MYSASSGFVDTLRFGSFLIKSRVTVYSNGAPTTFEVPISDCQITVDRNAAQRRSGSITAEIVPTVPPTAIMPTDPSSLLAPFGNEVFVEIAVLTDPSVEPTEWIPLGIFAIATTTIDDSTVDVVITLDVYDRSWVIAQRALLTPYNVPAAGGNFVEEVTHLINQVWNQGSGAQPLTFNITPTDYVVPSGTYNEGENPWTAVQDMAASAGYEVYFDVNGVVVGRPIPDPSQQATSWTFNQNSMTALGIANPPAHDYSIGQGPYSTPVATTVTLTRDGLFNDFIVSATGPQNAPGSASGSTAPARAESKDNNPNSPTYVGGGMGDVPSFVTDSLITTQAQAQAEADYDLAAALAKAWTISVSSPPNPLFDIDDVCAVYNSRLGLNGTRLVVDQIQTSVRYDSLMTLTGRVVP